MIRAIFFDFDGVIAESVDIKTEAFARLFGTEGPDVVAKVVEYHLANTGVSRFGKFKYIYEKILKRDLSEEEFRSLCGRFADMVKDLVVRAPYVDGAKDFLEKAASRYDLYLVSATPQEEIDQIISARGIRGAFKSVYGAPLEKSEAVRKALREYAIDPAEAVYVGDAMSDYTAARSNCVRFIARVSGSQALFDGIDCVKLKDLKGLEEAIRGL